MLELAALEDVAFFSDLILEELDLSYEISSKNGVFVHYLEKIQKDLDERDEF